MVYEYKGYSAIIDNKQILIYSLIIPKGLIQDFKMAKENILKYHTNPVKKIKIRKVPNEKRFKKEIEKVKKGTKC